MSIGGVGDRYRGYGVEKGIKDESSEGFWGEGGYLNDVEDRKLRVGKNKGMKDSGMILEENFRAWVIWKYSMCFAFLLALSTSTA